jgi:hypothetical protein
MVAARRAESRLAGGEACFDFGVQAYMDEFITPMQHPAAVWKSEPQWIAHVHIPRQEQISTPEKIEFCESLSFNGWHTPEDSRPLGELNALRGMIYKDLSSERHRANATRSGEPLSDYRLQLASPEEAKAFYTK